MDVERYVSGERLERRVAELAAIGGLPNGGMHRLPFTKEDGVARELFRRWLTDLGLRVWVDGGGNVIGRREGTDPDAPAVMSGSHLDTQPSGGRFDGIAGVLCALEAVEAMAEAGFRHRHPIEVVDWAAEEAAGRFDTGKPGSSAMLGQLTDKELAVRCRITGETLREAMESIGIDLSMLPGAERAPGSIKSVVELHIEQGPFLERAGKQIGVVTGVAGSTRFNCYVRGQQAHSGAMPMEGRRDALCGAAEILLAVERAASGRTEPRVVATVGYLDYNPRAVAIIPGRVHLIVDVRSVDPAACAEVVAEIRSSAESIAARRSLAVEWGPEWKQQAAKLDPDVVATVASACEELGVSYLSMISGGGHDAMTMAKRFPTAMLFVPSVGGISHAPEEFTRTDDLVTGARVLCRTLRKLAG